MPYSHYPHGFVNGVAIREMVVSNVYSGKANVFWVDSNKGSDGNKGNFSFPFATVNYAITQCTANNGDIIMVAEGHAETLATAAAINANIAGIAIVGVGTGNNRPTFTFTTATTATFAVNAADVYLYNLRFVCNMASQLIMLDLNAKRTIVDSCRFEEGTQTGVEMIDINGGGPNNCDMVRILNSEFYSTTAGNWAEAIEMGDGTDGVYLANNFILGNFSNAGIHNPTGKILTDLYIGYNTIRNLTTAKYAINLVSACTGRAESNYLYADAYATTFGPGNLFCNQNFAANAINTGGVPIPAASGNSTTFTGVGTTFYITKTFTSSAITTAAVDLTLVSSGGDLAVEEVVVKSDGTGLAGGTNFQVLSNNTKGLANILVETVANLGANKTATLENASVTKIPTVLESGKKLQISSTVGNCTGAGTIDIYVKFRRISSGATVAAA